MKKNLHPIVSAVFSVVFPVSTFIILLVIRSRLALSYGSNDALVFGFPTLFVLGISFAFILGIQTLRSTKELSSYKALILTLATVGILFGFAELGYFFWIFNFFQL